MTEGRHGEELSYYRYFGRRRPCFVGAFEPPLWFELFVFADDEVYQTFFSFSVQGCEILVVIAVAL